MKLLRSVVLPLVACFLVQAQTHRSDYCKACQRDSRGRIARSAAAKRAFRKTHPCPSTRSTHGPCVGFVIDHIKPLKRGGADVPSNMQYESIPEGKAKDKVE
jgi:hypothetical protein